MNAKYKFLLIIVTHRRMYIIFQVQNQPYKSP